MLLWRRGLLLRLRLRLRLRRRRRTVGLLRRSQPRRCRRGTLRGAPMRLWFSCLLRPGGAAVVLGAVGGIVRLIGAGAVV